MKIAFIGQKGIPVKTGGVEKHVEELARCLVEFGHEVFVYTRKNYTSTDLKEYEGIKLISLPSISTKHLDAISHTFFACVHVIFKRVDVIHFHSIGPSSLLWLVRLFKPKTPVIVTFHTQCYYHKKWGKFAKLCLKFGEWVACGFSTKIITVSETLTKYVKNKHKIESTYIPNGVSIYKKQSPDMINRWGLVGNDYILSVSRLVRHKGIHYLINAYKKLNTEKKLIIVGDSSFTDDYVKSLKDLAGDNKNIIFTGNQSGDVLKELFSNAWLFVQPSESEGLSIALLEAMSYSLPVIVSDIPENVEVVQDTGILFKNKNIDSLVDKLKKAEQNFYDLKILGEKGIKRVDKFYNWNNITNKIIKLYKGAIT
ncbi:glycosyltransferase family 4 protein [Candidatus Parcubacteria bacterium]|nr:glycosyltransferase family 4 protein [Candidatus Parcubacteria bacterium]